MKKTVLLVVLDGWGLGEKNESNPIYVVNPQNISEIKRKFSIGCLQASGLAIGLPWGEEGNSEVGHLTLGAGKTLYQYYPRISLSIRDGSFFQNKILKNGFEYARKNNGDIHLAGLLTSGNVHASLEHLTALLEFGRRENFERVYLHLFTDGRDSPPQATKELLPKLEKIILEKKCGILASLTGRFYAMDRGKHWDRTEKTYQILLGKGKISANTQKVLAAAEQLELNDAFIEPTIINEPHPVKEGDTLIFFNFREEGLRQLTAAFAEPNFSNFSVQKFQKLFVTTMTRYDEKFTLPVIFPPEIVIKPLGKVLSDLGKIQLRVAETEKYPHITFFFNGYRKEPFPNEYRILIPSPNVSHYEQTPLMMASAVTDRVINSLNEEIYDFILVNYANADAIGHTGNYEAGIKAVKAIDEEIGRLLKAVAARPETTMLITADHGNIEKIFDPLLGTPETQHNSSPVPIYLIGKRFEKPKSDAEAQKDECRLLGTLADVAPTVLELLDITPPIEMTGNSLLPFLK